LEYETKQKQYNKFLCGKRKVPNIRTIFIPSAPNLAHISSSDIRKMEAFQPGSADDLIYKPEQI